jgi:hypothetical protein
VGRELRGSAVFRANSRGKRKKEKKGGAMARQKKKVRFFKVFILLSLP